MTMKKTLTSILLCAALSAAATPLELNLSDSWKVYSSLDTARQYDATVPSTAMGVLTAAGVYPENILDGTNYRRVDRVQFNVPWWWRTRFSLPELPKDAHVTLDLDGISYRAEVWLNGHKVAASDTLAGTFRRHSIDITPYVGRDNDLALKVSRAREGEPNIGFVDWNPRPADESMGVFRPVRVRVTDAVRITSPAVKSKVNTATLAEADLTVEATLTNTSARKVKGTLHGSFDGRDFSRKLTLAPGETRTVSLSAADVPELHIDNPRLWWCRNMGKPEMYAMDLRFDLDGGRTTDRARVNFGIRDIKDYFTDEGHRGFLLNGKPVLVRSAGWTDDIFLRNDSARNEAEVRMVCDMNLNSIRCENVWGTSEYLYDLCDRAGLLVLNGWSCHWEWDNYLGTPCDEYGGIRTEEDMDLIARSLADQVVWLRNHPSIIAWFTGSDMMPRPELEKRYDKVMAAIDDRPCITAAKAMTSRLSGPTGTKMAGPYDYVAPSYWYAPEAPGGAFGWNTETGIGAQLPQRESIMRMIPADKLWPVAGDVWNYHCTASASDMNRLDLLSSVIDSRLGAATDFNDYVRKAEWINYDGTRTMFEAFRTRIPRATGIVQWMLNSAWPSLYWQVYDHYLVPTSAYYSLRHSNAPVQLIYDYGRKAVYAVNETIGSATLKASMKRYAIDAATPRVSEADITIEPYTVVKVFDVDDPATLDFVFLELTDGTGAGVARNFYVLSPDADVHDWAKSDWVRTPLAHHADYTALASLKPVELRAELRRDGYMLTVMLHNPGDALSFFNRLAAKDADGRLITPARWSDNYLTLQPGETITVACELPAGAPLHSVTLDGWNAPAEVELAI